MNEILNAVICLLRYLHEFLQPDDQETVTSCIDALADYIE